MTRPGASAEAKRGAHAALSAPEQTLAAKLAVPMVPVPMVPVPASVEALQERNVRRRSGRRVAADVRRGAVTWALFALLFAGELGVTFAHGGMPAPEQAAAPEEAVVQPVAPEDEDEPDAPTPAAKQAQPGRAAGPVAVDDGVVLLDLYDTSAGVAAQVNGVAVGQAAVDAYLAEMRSVDAAAAGRDYASETVDYLVDVELLRQAARELDVEVSADDVRDAYLEAQRGFADERAFESYLRQQHLGTGLFALACEYDLLRQGLTQAVTRGVTADDRDVLERLAPGALRSGRGVAATFAELDPAAVAEARADFTQQAQERAYQQWHEEYAQAATIEREGER